MLTALTAVLLAAGFGDTTVYNGPATRAAAEADRRAFIHPPAKASSPIGAPTMRLGFTLRPTGNTGELDLYRTHPAAVKALAQGEALAKAFGKTLKGFAAVDRNAIIGFEKRPTLKERTEAHGWLRTR
jgi:hypothetical protein